jgi:hypothetical protein
MEDYKGPVNIRLKQTARRKPSKEPKDEFKSTSYSLTYPMDGFATYTYVGSLFDIPKTTSIAIDELEEVHATFIPEPEITTMLKLAKLNSDKKGYTVDEIKAVLYLRGITIPTGTSTKKQYVELAKSSGVVSKV